MNSTHRPDSVEGADYVGVLRRRWWIVLGFALIGLVGAYGYYKAAPKAYSATAAVVVQPTGADQSNQVQGSRTQGPVNLDTEAAIVTSSSVSTIAAKLLHSSTPPSTLGQDVKVTVPPNSEVLDIACQAPTPAKAVACAGAFAKAYLQNRSATAAATISQQEKTLQAKANALQPTINSLSAKISALPSNSPQKLADETTLKTDQSNLHALTTQLSTLTGQGANIAGGYVAGQPVRPTQPSSPRKLLVLPAGLVVGLIIGLIGAFLWDRRDKRIHGAQDIERLFDLPVMLNLSPRAFSQQVSLASPRSRTGQAFTELAYTVAAALGEGSHVLVVTGASPGPAGSVIAANMAATLARTHSDVVLVCADPGDTVTPDMLGLSNGRGLADVAEGSATVREVVRGSDGIPGLWVITPGESEDTAEGLYLQHDTARRLLTALRGDARYVIIEAQAAGEGADGFALAEFADAALIAVEIPRTSRPEVADCVRRLRQLRTPVLGVAVSPPLSGKLSIRPVRQPPPRLSPGPGGERTGNGGQKGKPGARRGKLPSPRMPAATDSADRAAHAREGHGDPAGRLPGG